MPNDEEMKSRSMERMEHRDGGEHQNVLLRSDRGSGDCDAGDRNFSTAAATGELAHRDVAGSDEGSTPDGTRKRSAEAYQQQTRKRPKSSSPAVTRGDSVEQSGVQAYLSLAGASPAVAPGMLETGRTAAISDPSHATLLSLVRQVPTNPSSTSLSSLQDALRSRQATHLDLTWPQQAQGGNSQAALASLHLFGRGGQHIDRGSARSTNETLDQLHLLNFLRQSQNASSHGPLAASDVSLLLGSPLSNTMLQLAQRSSSAHSVAAAASSQISYPSILQANRDPLQLALLLQYQQAGLFASQLSGASPSPAATQTAFPAVASDPLSMSSGRESAPSRSSGPQAIGLELPTDTHQLSEYQATIRRQLEFFVAQQDDVESNARGRKKQVRLGQIGIRCKHCSNTPLRQRGRGAVYYPARLSGVYQAAQNMASSHLAESCHAIEDEKKQRLRTLRERRDTATGGKQYWVDACGVVGLYETPEGIFLRGSAT